MSEERPADTTPDSERLGDERVTESEEPDEPAATEPEDDDTPLGDSEEAAGEEGQSGKGEDDAPLPRERPYEPPPSTGAR
jgi:hypothetical protein